MTNTMSVQYIVSNICHWHSSESYQVGIQSVWYFLPGLLKKICTNIGLGLGIPYYNHPVKSVYV